METQKVRLLEACNTHNEAKAVCLNSARQLRHLGMTDTFGVDIQPWPSGVPIRAARGFYVYLVKYNQ